MNDKTEIKLYDKSNIDELQWNETDEAQGIKDYLLTLVKDGVSKYIKNIQTDLMILTVDDIIMPITLNNEEYNNAYTCSPYTHYFTYTLEEVKKIGIPVVEGILKLLLGSIGALARKVGFNKVIQVNNWILSTNTYPKLTEKQVTDTIKFLIGRFPKYIILFRTVSPIINDHLFRVLKKAGCDMVLNRRVFILDANSKYDLLSKNVKRQIKKDNRLMKKSDYQWCGIEIEDNKKIDRVIELYNSLFLFKYSSNNPQLTKEFIKLTCNKKIFIYQALAKNGVIYGVIASFVKDSIFVDPILGYDLNIPKTEGLYIILQVKSRDTAISMGAIHHESSGASDFKMNRGAKPSIEYNAVYLKQIPILRKIVWKLIKFLFNYPGKYVLEKFNM